MASVIAVDLGGTSIRAALYPTETPHPRQRAKIPTHPEHGLSAVLERLTWAIEPLIAQCEGEVRIGVAAPGPLDTERGIILTAANLPGWSDVPLRQLLESHFECPVRLGNDANLAALGEWRFGAGQGSSLLLYLTISTGIGGGIVSHGKLFLGARGYAAELGHITVHPDGAPCGCGKSGHVEAGAAGPGIAGRALSRLGGGGGKTLRRGAGPVDARPHDARGVPRRTTGPARRPGRRRRPDRRNATGEGRMRGRTFLLRPAMCPLTLAFSLAACPSERDRTPTLTYGLTLA